MTNKKEDTMSNKTTQEKIGELVGQASMLFYNKETKLLDGVFDEKQAGEIVKEILALILQKRIDELEQAMNTPGGTIYQAIYERIDQLKENK